MIRSTPKEAMKQIFSHNVSIQRWLDVEAALARAEASLGIIPTEVAEEISRKAKVEFLDMEKMEETRQKTWLPTIAFIRIFAAICQGDAGQYVHWGFSSPDLINTSRMLQIRDAHGVIYESLRRIEADLLDMAERHADTIMVGRSHNIQALPITFGYKVISWAREIRRQIQRLKECRERLFVVECAGAVGTMASFGTKGPQVQSLMAKELGLQVPDMSWRGARDRVAEFVNLLSIIAGTLARIANEVYLLMHTEIGEVAEPWQHGYVGSSTMPHKRNPFICETMISLAKKIRYNAALVTEFMVVEHEHNIHFLIGEMEGSRDACLSMGELLTHGENVAKNMIIYPERMKTNLGILKGLTQAEVVMLAPRLTRDIVALSRKEREED